MILVDTPVWIDHLRRSEPDLIRLLAGGLVSVHPFVTGELALGTLRGRRAFLEELAERPRPRIAFEAEVLMFIERNGLHGSGIGYVDAHLLVSARLTEGTTLWTRDRRLRDLAARLGVVADEA